MIGVPVALCDLSVSAFAETFGKSVVGRGETFTGRDNEDRPGSDRRREIVHVQRRVVFVDLAGERLSAGSGKWQEIIIAGERFRLALNGRRGGGTMVP